MKSHEFAFFVPAKELELTASRIKVYDPEVIHRITHVVRLKPAEQVILFTHDAVYYGEIAALTKKYSEISLRTQQAIVPLQPARDLVLPLLERDALQEVVYSATVHGVRDIYLVATDKSRKDLTEKEYLRLEKTACAAAEQSKQFALPVIHKPLSLFTFLDTTLATLSYPTHLWCEITGESAIAYCGYQEPAVVIVGPEGDFTAEEKERLARCFTPLKLTPTVLRAVDAARLVLGLLRL